MAYIPHWRITAHFLLGFDGTPVEEATCTLNFFKGARIWATDSQDIVNDAFADWAGFVQDGGGRVSDAVELDGVKMYSVDATGHIDEDPAIAEGTPVRGGFGTNRHPYQCTNVITLVAGARGKGRFGRIYLPPQAFDVGADGLISTTHHASMFTAAQTLLANLSNLAGVDTGWSLAVAGRTGTGTLRTVDTLRMGRVCDTQRRRRRSLDEAYSSAEFTA